MPSMTKPLDRIRTYLERLHATNQKNIPNILASGAVEPRRHPLDPRGTVPVVFTSAGTKHSYFDNDYSNRNSVIHFKIPKDWHRQHVVENPHYVGKVVEKGKYGYEANEMDRQAYDVMNGGRTTTYDTAIPNKFIDRICFGPNADMCYDVDTLRKHIVNESPDNSPDLWEWDYMEDFYPEYPEIFKKYGMK